MRKVKAVQALGEMLGAERKAARKLRTAEGKWRANRVTPRPEYVVAGPAPRARRLEYVTLPSLRCLADVDWAAKPWRPQGLEA